MAATKAPPKALLCDKAADALEMAENIRGLQGGASEMVRQELMRSIAYSLLAIAKFEIPMEGKG